MSDARKRPVTEEYAGKAIAKSTSQRGVYFVVDTLYGIRILASGSLAECQTYCRQHGIPTKVKFDW